MLTFYEYIQSKNRIRRLEEPRSQKEKPASFFGIFAEKGESKKILRKGVGILEMHTVSFTFID